ncbi:P-loop NTPase family protein [Motilibacter aurantiacus]|uniref:hypothetical protein n=1 Tax=Motilibacter aurantiacus TaxID=2714955 RepID=UPI0014091B98|nr:hypothetical protein [Motilibacter aurantiacus]NHC46968.1 hypothetical protein [Motilibacter aurantiacus]
MTQQPTAQGVRLAVGRVLTLLGPDALRRATLARLDDRSARCPAGHSHGGVVRVGAPLDPTRAGVREVLRAAAHGAPLGADAVPQLGATLDDWVAPLLGRQLAGLGPFDRRVLALAVGIAQAPAALVVDRLTDGLDAAGRRALLAVVRRVADDRWAVLLDDSDPVAALAVADEALRVGPEGLLVPVDPLAAPL